MLLQKQCFGRPPRAVFRGYFWLSSQGSLLAVFREPYVMRGIQTRSAAFEARILLALAPWGIYLSLNQLSLVLRTFKWGSCMLSQNPWTCFSSMPENASLLGSTFLHHHPTLVGLKVVHQLYLVWKPCVTNGCPRRPSVTVPAPQPSSFLRISAYWSTQNVFLSSKQFVFFPSATTLANMSFWTSKRTASSSVPVMFFFTAPQNAFFSLFVD